MGRRDAIAEPWGSRTPYGPGAPWPVRVDTHPAEGVSAEQVDRWVPSASILHSNGDAMDIAVKDGRIVGVRGRAHDRVNHGRLGPKDLFGWQANASADRLTRPLVRENGRLVETDWDTAAGTGMLLSGSAHAAQPYARTGKTLEDPSPIFHLPVGLHIPCSMYASDVALNLSGPGALTLDFKGDIEVLVRESGPDRHVLEVTAFRAVADPKPSTPDVGSLFVLQLSSTASTPLSTLTPGLLRVHLPRKVTTIDKATGEETTLASTDPTKHLTLRSENVEEFPPRNQQWTQEAPVSLYQPGGSEAVGSRVTGTLEGFNPLVNQAI